MKKCIIISLLFLSASKVFCQVFTPMAAAGYQNKRTKTDSTNYIPTFCGTPNLRSINPKKQGAIAFDSCNHRFYFYDPKRLSWDTVKAAGAPPSQFYDSTSINYNGTRYVYYSGITAVDSVLISASLNLGTANLSQTSNFRNYNANNRNLTFTNLNSLWFQNSPTRYIYLGAASLNLGHTGNIVISAPNILIPSLTNNNALGSILVQDPSGGKIYYRDVSTISVAGAETDPIWSAASANYRTLSQNNLLYAPLSHSHPASDIISGIFTIPRGGTGLSVIGTVGQSLRVATGGTALEYYTPVSASETDPLSVHIADSAAMLLNYKNAINSNAAAILLKQNIITTGTTAQYFRGDLSLATFPTIPPAWQTPGQLTDGATITWNLALTTNDSVTLAGNRTLSITNPVAGMFGTLVVKQDGTGSRTLTLPANAKVISGGAGAVTLTTTAGAKDILTFYYDGNFFYVNYGKNYN